MFSFPKHPPFNIFKLFLEKQNTQISQSHNRRIVLIDPSELFLSNSFNIFDLSPKIIKNTREALVALSTIYDVVCVSEQILKDSALYQIIDPLGLIKSKIHVPDKSSLNYDFNKKTLLKFSKEFDNSLVRNTVTIKNTNSMDLVDIGLEMLKYPDIERRPIHLSDKQSILKQREANFNSENIFNSKSYVDENKKVHRDRIEVFNQIYREHQFKNRKTMFEEIYAIPKQHL